MLALVIVVCTQSASVQAADYVSRSLVKLNAVYYSGSSSASSNTSTITVGSTTATANAKITSIVITSSKSSSSTGTLTLHVENATTGYSDSKAWSSSVTFSGLNGTKLVGKYNIYFTGSRVSTSSIAAATINSAVIKIYYE